jgi:hypothetical protein
MRLILVLGSTSQIFSKTSHMEAKNYPQREKRKLTKPWLSLGMGPLDAPSLSTAILQPAIREPSSLLLSRARLLSVTTCRRALGSILATSESFRSAGYLRQVRTRKTGMAFASCCSSLGSLHVSLSVHFFLYRR